MKILFSFLAAALIGFCFVFQSAVAQDDQGLQGAGVGWGYLLESDIAFDYPGVTLLVLPDGSGRPFDGARWFDGAVVQIVDGTISVQIRDENAYLCVDYPREDVWLEPMDPTAGNLAFCPGGNIADQDTDRNGSTFWRLPLRAGGWSQAGVQVHIAAGHLPDGPLPLQINSPDIDGDLRITLSDVTIFSGDYFGEYHFRSDVNFDNTINLLDLTRMMAAWGKSCL